MIPADTVLLLLIGAACFQVATLIGLLYLARTTDPRPPKAGWKRGPYWGKP